MVVLVATAPAAAQIAPGGMGPAQQPAGETKKEGVAEAAPKPAGLLPTTPALPPAKGRRKRWKLLEIDGYFRTRTDWFKNFNLGFNDDPLQGGAPFPRPLACGSPIATCDDSPSLSSANMRLRLEPTINLDEGTSIHIQADVLDNLVLGSTPINQFNGVYDSSDRLDPGRWPPLGAFGNSQTAPTAGVNSDRDSIIIKRAWAEIAVPLGILKIGRMPNHWGMGMLYNSGSRDPVTGINDVESDWGDNVDRASFSTIIPGTNLRAMIASDWNVTRLVSNQTSANKGREQHPWDLDDEDDANSWVGVVSRMDSPQEFKDKVDRGELAINYGVYFEYRTQSWDDDLSGFTLGGTFDAAANYRPRGLTTYSPDLWARLGYGRILLEAEAVAQLGSLDNLDEFGLTRPNESIKIRKYGGVARFTFKGLEGKLRIGLEGGAASGDVYDNIPPGNTNIGYANLIGAPGTTRLRQFMFNREYRVDMILWRHLVGAVTNAGYGKPFLGYDLTKSIAFNVANITSFALKPVATPGNSTMYGTEFNANISYNSGGLLAWIGYGVLFPMGALSHPEDDAETGAVFGFSPDNTGDAATAHTIQARVVLSF